MSTTTPLTGGHVPRLHPVLLVAIVALVALCVFLIAASVRGTSDDSTVLQGSGVAAVQERSLPA